MPQSDDQIYGSQMMTQQERQQFRDRFGGDQSVRILGHGEERRAPVGVADLTEGEGLLVRAGWPDKAPSAAEFLSATTDTLATPTAATGSPTTP
mgnify:CR=1 FL=1